MMAASSYNTRYGTKLPINNGNFILESTGKELQSYRIPSWINRALNRQTKKEDSMSDFMSVKWDNFVCRPDTDCDTDTTMMILDSNYSMAKETIEN